MLTWVVAAAVAGCSSDDSAVCVSNDVGDVCADESNGANAFNATGLAPGSEVPVVGPEEHSLILRIGADGAYAPAHRVCRLPATVIAFDSRFLGRRWTRR